MTDNKNFWIITSSLTVAVAVATAYYFLKANQTHQEVD